MDTNLLAPVVGKLTELFQGEVERREQARARGENPDHDMNVNGITNRRVAPRPTESRWKGTASLGADNAIPNGDK